MKYTVIGPAILAALMGLAACGQRGPLVLPQPAEAGTASAPSPTGATRR